MVVDGIGFILLDGLLDPAPKAGLTMLATRIAK